MTAHIMIDLETLGTLPGCKILSIGAVRFSQEGLHEEFYTVLDTDSQSALHESPDTVAWWARQAPEARRVFDAPDKRPFNAGMEEFSSWCSAFGSKRSVYPWGNGADFDNAILHVAFSAASLAAPWEYWNSRCYRTLKSFKGAPKLTRQGTHHHALDDAKTQAEHAVLILNELSLW